MTHRLTFPRHHLVLSVMALLLSAQASDAQQVRKDPTLDRFAGAWRGTFESMGATRDCDVTAVWVLEDSFLEITMKVWRDASRKALLREERTMVRHLTDEQQSAYVFTSDGTSRWGTWVRQGPAIEMTMSWSSGLSETGLISWRDANSYDHISTVQDETGEIVLSMRLHLTRVR